MRLKPTIQYDCQPEYRQGQIVFFVFGWRIRFYLGHSFFDRPRVHYWRAHEHRGITLRRKRGVGEQPVVGIQWRRA